MKQDPANTLIRTIGHDPSQAENLTPILEPEEGLTIQLVRKDSIDNFTAGSQFEIRRAIDIGELNVSNYYDIFSGNGRSVLFTIIKADEQYYAVSEYSRTIYWKVDLQEIVVQE